MRIFNKIYTIKTEKLGHFISMKLRSNILRYYIRLNNSFNQQEYFSKFIFYSVFIVKCANNKHFHLKYLLSLKKGLLYWKEICEKPSTQMALQNYFAIFLLILNFIHSMNGGMYKWIKFSYKIEKIYVNFKYSHLRTIYQEIPYKSVQFEKDNDS
jgi:hypothetical protein